MSPTSSPARTSSVTSSTAWLPPKRTLTPSVASHGCRRHVDVTVAAVARRHRLAIAGTGCRDAACAEAPVGPVEHARRGAGT